jgi:hypothetical protein
LSRGRCTVKIKIKIKNILLLVSCLAYPLTMKVEENMFLCNAIRLLLNYMVYNPGDCTLHFINCFIVSGMPQTMENIQPNFSIF